MSTLLGLVLNTHTLCALLGGAAGAWGWPRVSGMVSAWRAKAAAVESDLKK